MFSDFPNLSLTVLKIFYKKQCSNIVRFRNYRNFDNELFMNDVEKSISQEYCQNQFLEFGALLTNLSKDFDWLSHKLLIAKWDAYRFDEMYLILTYFNLNKE